MSTYWRIAQPNPIVQQALAMATGLSPLLCQLLINRGITDAVAAQAFLSPSLHDLLNPYLLHGMEQAVQRLVAALRQGERIAIYGDYDVDGVTGTALLITFFRELGMHVPYYIPERSRQGYGLHAEALQQLASEGVRVLITVDCGITAKAEVALARRLGIDVIITDHHQPPAELPPALAVLNPHQPACTYPNKDLCGVGVVFKLLTALRAALRQAHLFPARLPNLKRHLDLVTLGTIADVTPLLGENRILVHYGLRELSQTHKPGLQALRQVSGRQGKTASTGEVGFHLAPRLNASGRLGSAAQSVALLTAADWPEATALAQAIEGLNQQRRLLQQEIEAAVHARIARQYGGQPPAAIVLADPTWHLGVVGIVAARIAEIYRRPTFLLQIDGHLARGSGRSIATFDLYAALCHCAPWLQQFGGHRYAAGLTLEAAQVPSLQQALIQYAQTTLDPTALQPTLDIDASVSLAELTPALVEQLARLAPHGAGNPPPLLCAQDVQLASAIRTMGEQGQHARFRIVQHDTEIDAVAFRLANQVTTVTPHSRFDIAFTPVLHTWNGRQTVELHVRALRPSPATAGKSG